MISFIIPTKNEETVLDRTLGYISKYSGEKEIIISDGRSTDRTIEIAKKYTDKIFIFNGEGRQTIASARNEAAKIAKGDMLVFLDADVCIFDPNDFFSKAFGLFSNIKGLVGLTVYVKALPEVATLSDKFFLGFVNRVYYVFNNIFHHGISHGEFQMIRTDVFRKIGGYNEKLPAAEDSDLFYRLSKNGVTRIEPKMTAYHTSRRAHKVGWIKLILTWHLNWLSMTFLKRSLSSEWKEIR